MAEEPSLTMIYFMQTFGYSFSELGGRTLGGELRPSARKI